MPMAVHPAWTSESTLFSGARARTKRRQPRVAVGVLSLWRHGDATSVNGSIWTRIGVRVMVDPH